MTQGYHRREMVEYLPLSVVCNVVMCDVNNLMSLIYIWNVVGLEFIETRNRIYRAKHVPK